MTKTAKNVHVHFNNTANFDSLLLSYDNKVILNKHPHLPDMLFLGPG